MLHNAHLPLKELLEPHIKIQKTKGWGNHVKYETDFNQILEGISYATDH